MHDRLIPECEGEEPDPLEPGTTEEDARNLATELRQRLAGVLDAGALAELDDWLSEGKWLAAIGVGSKLCLLHGVRVPSTVMDFDQATSCEVHDACLDDFEGVTQYRFMEPDPPRWPRIAT